MRLTLEITRDARAVLELSRTLTVQTASLPAAVRHDLERLAAAPAISEAVAPSAAARGARRYALTIDDGTHRRTERFCDPVVDARLRALRDLVSLHGAPGPGPARHGGDDATGQSGGGDALTLRLP